MLSATLRLQELFAHRTGLETAKSLKCCNNQILATDNLPLLNTPQTNKNNNNQLNSKSEGHGKLSGVGECSHEELQTIGLSLLSLSLGKCETGAMFYVKIISKSTGILYT